MMGDAIRKMGSKVDFYYVNKHHFGVIKLITCRVQPHCVRGHVCLNGAVVIKSLSLYVRVCVCARVRVHACMLRVTSIISLRNLSR